jgi:hypothetical protein
METTYKGFVIKEVFRFRNTLKSDWQIYPPDGEYGTIFPYSTLEDVFEFINDKLED